MARHITPVPLTGRDFAPFGEVIETRGAERRLINAGSTVRFHDLARVDVAAHGGYPLINLFRAQPLALPLTIGLLEQHPLGSQAFVPLKRARFLVVVAPGNDAPGLAGLRAFITDGRQGVSYARGTWHHPVIALGRETDFLVVDRGGPGDNLAEARLGADREAVVVQPPR